MAQWIISTQPELKLHNAWQWLVKTQPFQTAAVDSKHSITDNFTDEASDVKQDRVVQEMSWFRHPWIRISHSLVEYILWWRRGAHARSSHHLHVIYHAGFSGTVSSFFKVFHIWYLKYQLLRKWEVYEQDAQLSQRDRAAGCVIVLSKSGRLELGDNILLTL